MSEQELFRQYVKEVSEWGTQVEQILLQRDDGMVHRDIAALLSYIDKHEGEWTEADIYDLQRMVDEAHEKATAILANEPLADEGEEIGEEGERSQTYIAAGRHVLPPLPYSYDALEPYISKEIMQLHHTKHHQSYVDGLNKAEKMMKKARETNNYELLKHWEREAAFHGSGHYLHTIFWNNMHPKGGGEPHGELLEQIKRDFGSFERFKRHFTEAAKSAEGVGWALLVWSPRSHRLEILQTEKHQFMTQWDTIPLLVLDVWEHAYYLQYKSDRAAYINNWWNVVHWRDVEERFAQAQKLRWKPF
ncbi:superoxide dismutase [Parageobacillus thermoglucosidasius]|jgi:superoxide dismutase, Fe-Mn family|uniref:superoxide dismutase n=1 Tax=Parageobacillus thermoglucosidasius TaxID=1426 RepID=A0A1B7KXB8_PARTM|nr:superoxide dismutase [Parageobacillus thermoglucosidasius]OAT74713.1 superoxide dismutase [Parageobacillus thermoglucosidasius]